MLSLLLVLETEDELFSLDVTSEDPDEAIPASDALSLPQAVRSNIAVKIIM